MDIDSWLTAARADAEARGLHALVPLLESLAQSTRNLRSAAEDTTDAEEGTAE